MDISPAANPFASSARFTADSAPVNGGLGSTLNEGLNGIQSASGQLLNSAHSIATSYSTVQPTELNASQAADLAADLVNQRQAQVLFTASAEVVSVADELAGKLLDEMV